MQGQTTDGPNDYTAGQLGGAEPRQTTRDVLAVDEKQELELPRGRLPDTGR